MDFMRNYKNKSKNTYVLRNTIKNGRSVRLPPLGLRYKTNFSKKPLPHIRRRTIKNGKAVRLPPLIGPKKSNQSKKPKRIPKSKLKIMEGILSIEATKEEARREIQHRAEETAKKNIKKIEQETQKKLVQNSQDPDLLKNSENLMNEYFEKMGIAESVDRMNKVTFANKYLSIKHSDLSIRQNKQLDEDFKIVATHKNISPLFFKNYIKQRNPHIKLENKPDPSTKTNDNGMTLMPESRNIF